MNDEAYLCAENEPEWTPKVVAIGKKLLDANAAFRQIWGDRYEEQILPWKQALLAIQCAVGEPVAQTLLLALKSAKDAGQTLALCAAAVDLMREESPCPAK